MANTGHFNQCICPFPQPFPKTNIVGTISKVFKTEFLKVEDGASYSRQHVCGSNPNQWKEVSEVVRPRTPPQDKSLWVVSQRQTGKGPHWSLFAAVDDDTDSPEGRIWQVNGDADVGMHYAHRGTDQSVPISLTASFADSLLVCDNLSEHWEAKVDEMATTIKAPGPHRISEADQPRKMDHHRGTCKTWVWEVLEELVKEGIVSDTSAAEAKNLPPLEPLKEFVVLAISCGLLL